MKKSTWLYGGIASLFIIPMALGIPIGALNGQQYWLIYYVLSGSQLVGPLVAFWIALLLPLAVAGFCFYNLIRAMIADRKAARSEEELVA